MNDDQATAHAALYQLLAQYALAADHAADPKAQDAARRAFARLFTPDARIEVRGQVVVEGAEAWQKVVEQSAQGLRATQHLLGLPAVDIDGDRASLTCSLQATRIGEQGEVTRIHGTYEATAVRASDSDWQLSHLALKVLAIDPPLPFHPATEDPNR